MGNFDFLLEDKDYAPFAVACIEAEKSLAVSTVITAFSARRALEMAVKWVYSFDQDLELPFRDNLSTLVNDTTFKQIIDRDLSTLIAYIIKLGNASAHSNVEIKREEAVLALSNLFQFVEWLDMIYGGHYQRRRFDPKLLPDSLTDFRTKEKPASMEALIEASPTPSLKAMKADTKTTRQARTEPLPADQAYVVDKMSEADTRRLFIDVDLRLAGWTLGQNAVVEVPVKGMPNTSGDGFVDYVLYGKNGLPLAVVEAKKTSKSSEVGRQQAILYADLLEKETGQRPQIYYTNGFSAWFIEDDYPARKVAGFHTQDELQRSIDRRKLRKPLASIGIQDAISGRPYQKVAITSVLESFEQKRRKALLVMATGSGKTRTAVSIVDIMTKANWAKNILFLADRTSLVKQAFRNFNQLMPDLTLCNLLEKNSKENDPQTSRMIFSTYPTMLNAIDSLKMENDRLFSVGHFDLIIIDEAHRSIFQKYKAIFDYFDALCVGLTATPRDDIDRNTYELFELENDVPTFAYDLDDAVRDKYLVPYQTIETKLKLPEEGIHYDDLSESDKEAFDDTFEDDPTIGKDIDGQAINNWLFNRDTVDKVLKQVMEKAMRDASGDEIGKTIIFAKNHKHAQLIKERFDRLFPQKGSKYAEVIDYSVNYYQSLIDDFSVKTKLPRIAISVDMLDTGIDVPELVNLVFFKKVRSKIKFFQMIGRGTRLCPDLFGPGIDKQGFLIFDYGRNFEFFRLESRPSDERLTLSLTQRLFDVKVDLIRELQDLRYQEPVYQDFRQGLIDELCGKVAALDENNFQVRMALEEVVKYRQLASWQSLNPLETIEMKQHLSGLMIAEKDDEMARRFDLSLFSIELGDVMGRKNTQLINRVMETADALRKLGTIDQVKAKKDLIFKALTPEFWLAASLTDLEEVRLELRDLIQLIPYEGQKSYYTNFADQIMEVAEDAPAILSVNDLQTYRQKVEHYLKAHMNTLAIYKLHHNLDLTMEEVRALEQIFWHELGTKEQYEKDFGDKSVTRLVREIVGLDKAAANAIFAEFLSDEHLNARQLHFIKLLVDVVSEKGIVEKSQLVQEPFKTAGNLTRLFGEDRARMLRLIGKLDEIQMKIMSPAG